MQTQFGGFGEDAREAIDAFTDEDARQLLTAVDRYGKLPMDRLDDVEELDDLDRDSIETAATTLEQAGLAIEQREITDTGAETTYETTFRGEQFMEAVKYGIEGADTSSQRYSGGFDDGTIDTLELLADPATQELLVYMDGKEETEFRELRLYMEEQGVEEPYQVLRDGLRELEGYDLAWTQDDFDPERGNTIRCGLYTDGEDLVEAMNDYSSDGRVERPDNGAGRP